MKKTNNVVKFAKDLKKEISTLVKGRADVPNYGSFYNKFVSTSNRVIDFTLDWDEKREGDNIYYFSKFEVGGRIYELTLSSKNNKVLNLEFDFKLLNYEDNKSGRSITGTGNSFEVMSKVNAALAHFISYNKRVKTCSFRGSEKSRIKLYETISKSCNKFMFASGNLEDTWDYKKIENIDETVFVLTRSNNKLIDPNLIDIDILISSNDNNNIPDLLLDTISYVEDNPNLLEYKVMCGYHPYIHSKKYSISGIKKLKIEQDSFNKIKSIFDINKEVEYHNMIKLILSKELALIWSKEEIDNGYKEFKGKKIYLEEYSKYDKNKVCVNLEDLKRVTARYKNKNYDIPVELMIKTKDTLTSTLDDYTEHFNVKLEYKLLREKYYDMYKILRSFCNAIFKYKMYRLNYFNSEQLNYLKTCYARVTKEINPSDNNVKHIVMDAYQTLLTLKIFKKYGQ